MSDIAGEPADPGTIRAGAPAGSRWVCVRAPAKINLSLAVGPLGADGYHDIVTVFHAIDLYDTVTVRSCPPGRGGIEVRAAGVVGDVPADESNLAWRAAAAVAEALGVSCDVHISIDKRIPVAAGLAGGSADAAAAIVACHELWGGQLDRSALGDIAASLGSDVSFALVGGTMLGSGRGQHLNSVLARGTLHWVLAVSDDGLSTPHVYSRLDELRARRGDAPDAADPAAGMLSALAAGDIDAIADALSNDLQEAAISLRPGLADVLHTGAGAGAAGALVSGSGPTCVFLCASDSVAIDVGVALTYDDVCDRIMQARGPVAGAFANISAGWV